MLSKDINRAVLQAPPITTDGCPRVSGAGAIDVTGYAGIKFDTDGEGLNVNEGSTSDASNYHKMGPSEAFGLGDGVTHVYVSGACGYLLIQGPPVE